MCDTLVVLGNSSEDGSIIFGKNSDRDPGEVHAVCYIPRANHEDGDVVHCQYIDIPQVKTTYAVILSKPAWLKIGCEMGANECGVVMGNEAVFTKEPYERKALLGMDLMTIALQRAQTTRESITIITDLIEKYGQGGVASMKDPNYIYHNSFIIADLKEAWILETANKFWVAKKVKDVASISNGLTIQDKWDLASPRLIENAIEKGWCESKADFNFAECYSDPQFREISGCIQRQSKTINSLLEKKGEINISTVMDILRTHDKEPFRPDKGTMSSICGHYNSQTVHQTTGSYVASLTPQLQVHWLTGTSAPCLSLFKPFFFENPEPINLVKIPSLTNDNKSLWWKHEKLHRLTLMDYQSRAPIIIQKSRELEQQLINKVNEIKKNLSTINKEAFKIRLNEISSKAVHENFSLIESLTKNISKMEINKSPRKSYLKFWISLSEKDGLPLS